MLPFFTTPHQEPSLEAEHGHNDTFQPHTIQFFIPIKIDMLYPLLIDLLHSRLFQVPTDTPKLRSRTVIWPCSLSNRGANLAHPQCGNEAKVCDLWISINITQTLLRTQDTRI